MTSAGWATLDVIPSFKGFRSALDKGVSSDMATVGRTSGAKFGDQAGKAAGGRFKSKFTEGLKGIAGPVAGIFAGAAIVDTFKDAISGASDLAESGNKIQAIFGEATARITGFASDAANAFGQTRVQALDAAATFGTFGKAAGLSGGELAGFSEKMVGLSSDLASFYNTDPTQAIEAIGAALRGESEPIRSYGVLLDDATLRQEAMRQGLIQTTKQALTPQQKVLAAYQVILKQTSDAQGDFGRTSGGLANQQRILAAQWTEMKTNLGSKLLPAAVGVAHAFNDDVIPAVEATGGAVSDAAHVFGDLPTPVKAATAAFVAFRVAAAAGLTANIASGAASIGSALTGLRIRALLAADAFREARGGVYEFTGNTGRIVAPVGRVNASLSALRTGAIGAGGALKSSLGGAAALVGGPWGLAFIAATATAAHFWSEHKRAKQFVDDLTGSLDKQTGAVTDNTRELVFNSLQKSGAVDAAKRLGISLDDLRRAALGNGDALQAISSRLDVYQIASAAATGNPAAFDANREAVAKLRDALGDQNGALADARDGARDYADFMGKGKDATNDTADANGAAADSFKSLADRIADAKDKINDLAKAEQKRRLANLKNRQDKLALIEQMQATAAEATNTPEASDINKQIRDARESGARERANLRKQLGEKGANKGGINAQIAKSYRDQAESIGELTKRLGEYRRTLDPATKAGQENLKSLYDLAEQWNNSSTAVRNTKGEYDKVRQSFIDSAVAMGDTRKDARKLAHDLLLVPKRKRIDVDTPGMAKALADLQKLKDRVRDAGKLSVYVNTKQANDPRLGNNANGTDFWRGGPTWVGERGPEIVNLPRGSQVIPNDKATAGVNVQIGTVVAQDYRDFMTQMQRRSRAANGGGVNF